MNDVSENSLTDELFALDTRQIVDAVLLQVNDFAVLKLEFPVIGQAFDFDVEGLGGFDVGGEVNAIGKRHPVDKIVSGSFQPTSLILTCS
jgi:hypothetical protein